MTFPYCGHEVFVREELQVSVFPSRNEGIRERPAPFNIEIRNREGSPPDSTFVDEGNIGIDFSFRSDLTVINMMFGTVT